MSGKILLPLLCLSLAVNLSFGGLYVYGKVAGRRSVSGTEKADRAGRKATRRPRCILDRLEFDESQKERLASMRKVVWRKRDRFHHEMDRLRRAIGRAIAGGSAVAVGNGTASGGEGRAFGGSARPSVGTDRNVADRDPNVADRDRDVADRDRNVADRERIRGLVRELGRRQTVFRMEVVDHLLQVKAMLSTHQLERFRTLLETRIFSGAARRRAR
jgi:hypothetical protein